MSKHLLEMRSYMELSDIPSMSSPEVLPDDEFIDIDVGPDIESLIADLETLKFKFINHVQVDGSDEYALGFEEAFNKAAAMINRILEKHSDDNL